MSESVTIEVPARLHLGFLDIPGSAPEPGRERFGSIGLPITGISTQLKISLGSSDQVEGDESDRISRHLSAVRHHLGLNARHRIIVQRTIPQHVGLGSGTQLALAVAAGIRVLHNLPLDPVNDASLLGRGMRSGIGIAAFRSGGLIIDAGKSPARAAPTIVARLPFPEDWRAILVSDATTQGIHGEDEIEAFKTLPPFPSAAAASISRHVLMGVMPGVVERDITLFGHAIHAIQTEIGNYFAPAQGGVFTSRQVEAAMGRLSQAGAVGVGQSSWGPTGFAFAASESEAERIVNACREATAGVNIEIVAGKNSGAHILRPAASDNCEVPTENIFIRQEQIS
jgi:beta-ribofuranosylaminobenzene 5'-phosphate synthase